MKEKSINEAKAWMGHKKQVDLRTTQVTGWELARSSVVSVTDFSRRKKRPVRGL